MYAVARNVIGGVAAHRGARGLSLLSPSTPPPNKQHPPPAVEVLAADSTSAIN
jgi:hypothetical protein